MEGQSRSSSKNLLLQVWCGVLTVAMVAMAALLATIKLKSDEDGVPTLKPDNVSPTVSSVASQQSIRSNKDPSYIQLTTSWNKSSWEIDEPRCDSCSLVLLNNAIHCKKNSIYFIYAQVDFSKHSKGQNTKSVILIRNPTNGKAVKTLVVGTFPNTTEGSVWVARIVSLKKGDNVSLNITSDFLSDSTFWGAYQLH
ncbi:uncharacterized protein LOC121906310 [Scomber scombrus]|uniref:Uncharacterized protein LOC121906310 n=1 Tax=Scomber scombrus TaxID=13677 RepID=A0AAV1NHA7_SCOSC